MPSWVALARGAPGSGTGHSSVPSEIADACLWGTGLDASGTRLDEQVREWLQQERTGWVAVVQRQSYPHRALTPMCRLTCTSCTVCWPRALCQWRALCRMQLARATVTARLYGRACLSPPGTTRMRPCICGR